MTYQDKMTEETLHYHTLGGLTGGFMPNWNNVHRTLADAKDDLRWYIEQLCEGVQCDKMADDMYADVGEHEYVEVTECWESECLEELED